jgi:DNA-directed RNA polymerase I, II, and III subunit RPABC2
MSDTEDYDYEDESEEEENVKKNKKVKIVKKINDDENDSVYSDEDNDSDIDIDSHPIKSKLITNKNTIDEDEAEVEAEDEEEDEDEDEDGDEDEDADADANPINRNINTENNFHLNENEEEEEEEEDEDDIDDKYLQKFDDVLRKNIISEHHPEMQQHNYEEVETMCKIIKNKNGVIVDPFHKTLPILTKYEKARILGERAKQINSGADLFIEVESNITDGYLIAMKELEQKKIPFVVKRPLPNGGCEYWKLADLEILC